MPVLWRITEDQVLASAGLDAFVFLAFFKMAIKFLVFVLFWALVVIKPVHDSYPDETHRNGTHPAPDSFSNQQMLHTNKSKSGMDFYYEADYLWMYLVFAYFFTGAALYLIITESRRIIQVRQNYLGSQVTVTDRTIRLGGIPASLQEETKIKDFIEELGIGKVESVLLCRNWHSLDTLMEKRDVVLRKLERALVEHEHRLKEEASLEALPTSNPSHDSDEDSRLLVGGNGDAGSGTGDPRPKERIWFGKWNLKHRYVDAIDHFEEKLRILDDEITRLRKSKFPTMPLAFVTMDSVAACQMAVQAVLDASPLQLIATTSPAPVDVDWKNTYMPKRQYLIRFWAITALIFVLTLFWSVVLAPLAVFIDLDRIKSIWPELARMLNAHPLGKSLVQTQLPTLIISGLNVAVPYFYSWLSYQQGMISNGDVELSVISKNFFFTFFNFFIVFTALGTVSMSWSSFGSEPLRDIADKLASSIQDLRQFYVNYIILQAFGLFPFRLVEFGSVSLYPFGLVAAKTPRDHAELRDPPTFSYGFYLPQTILIFLMCIVYSVLRSSWQVLVPGLAYFVIGYFVYKYQLLYAMDHQQHSTGKGWVIIVDRIIVGLIIFQVSMAGQLVLKAAVKRSVLIVPLVVGTLWFSLVFSSSYKPLMTYIALRSIRRAEHADDEARVSRYDREAPPTTVDESRESGLRFINPNLVIPLEQPWIKGPRPKNGISRSSSYERARDAS